MYYSEMEYTGFWINLVGIFEKYGAWKTNKLTELFYKEKNYVS